MGPKVVLFFIALYVVLMNVPNAQGYLSDSLGVQLSKSCLALVKLGDKTSCPTYEEVLFLFPDSSDQSVSGRLVFDGNFVQRGPEQMKNAEEFYRYDPTKRFFVDPHKKTGDKIKLIVIEPRLDEYKLDKVSINSTSLRVGIDRYVNPNCTFARISAIDWPYLLGDTINYMGHGCQANFTSFDHVKIKRWEPVIHDLTTSYKYQLEQWIKKAIEECGQRVCIPR